MNKQHTQTLKYLGRNFMDRRLGAGLTMEMLAKLSGVSKGQISKIEKGGNPTALTLYKLSGALGIHPIGLMPAFWSGAMKGKITGRTLPAKAP